MSGNKPTKGVVGMNVGSATLVMVFSVLCLTIFAALSVVTAQSEWNLAQKTADAVTAYYQADSIGVDIFNQMVAQYDGAFTLPEEYPSQLDVVDGVEYASYWIAIDETQNLWVQVYQEDGIVKVARWQVEESGTWITDQSLDVWAG